MKRRRLRTTRAGREGGRNSRQARRGSTLLIVIALLGLLALLGFLFYTFAAQERENAEYFAFAAKGETDSGASVDELFDFALEQLIVGPTPDPRPGHEHADQMDSALWGRRHSLVSNMLGQLDPITGRPKDVHPFTGPGDPSGPINYSPAARWSSSNNVDDYIKQVTEDGSGNDRPQPDVDYTYPDRMNLFLAYRGFTFDAKGYQFAVGPDGQPGNAGTDDDGNGTVDDKSELGWPGSDDQPLQVIIPSFHRPQQFLGPAGAGWETDPTKADLVMRPHPSHVNFVDGSPRFLGPDGAPGGGDDFPFSLTPTGPIHQGIWQDPKEPGAVHFDVDNDGDGIKEGIWLDLDHPVQETPTGQQYIPLYSFTVYDLDALLNLNIVGNLWGNTDLTNPVYGAGRFLSRSNEGLGPAEVNPQWALDASPWGPDRISGTADDPPSSAFDQQRRFFHPPAPSTSRPADAVELANMEWWWLNVGRPNYGSSGIDDLYAGRWGELQRLNSGAVTRNVSDFPKPGRSGVDDDSNQGEGEATGGRRAFGQPHDFRGTGRCTLSGNPKYPDLQQPVVGNPSRWLRYTGYDNMGTVPWPFMQFSNANSLWDDPLEVIAALQLADRPDDEIFGPQDVPYLHMSDTDISIANEPPEQRLGELAKFNFTFPEIRQRFTTDSWDRKQFATERFSQRNWEFNADANRDGKREFPPQFGEQDLNNDGILNDGSAGPLLDETADKVDYNFDGDMLDTNVNEDTNGNGALDDVPPYSSLDPFRTVVRRLLQILADDKGQSGERRFQLPLSVNELLDVQDVGADPRTGTLKFRPLTEHPTGLSATPIPQAMPPFPPNNAVQQEYWARRDRQKLARDIYVLLYTFCGGDDNQDYTLPNEQPYKPDPASPGNFVPNGDRPIYTNDELREMAQFAVNVVDAMDRDKVITLFEYDRNLNDGWNLDDNPYPSSTGDSVPAVPSGVSTKFSDRQVVYGVEAQQLTLSEALAIRTEKIEDATPSPFNHQATEYDDRQHRYFTYLELRNMSPRRIDFGSGIWQLRMTPRQGRGRERRLTLLPSAGGVDAGQLYTVGTAGDDTVLDTSVATPSPYSVMKVDPGWTTGAVPSYVQIAPAEGLLNLDLIKDSPTGRFVITGVTNTVGVNNYTSDLMGAPPAGGDPQWGPGAFFDWTVLTDPNVDISTLTADDADPLQPVTFSVWRRANPSRQAPAATSAGSPEDRDNPWVEVDQITFGNPIPGNPIGLKVFKMDWDTQDPDIAPRLKELQSLERAEPLARSTEQAYPRNTRANSLSGSNHLSPSRFSVWQPHFDRDFASIIDLFAVPLVGPDRLTTALAYNNPARMTGVGRNGEGLAERRFLRNVPYPAPSPPPPEYPNQTEVNELNHNRWHRLLEFVEVPSRTHEALGNPLDITSGPGKVNVNTVRVPGKINVNTIRHPEVLAALLDDTEVFRTHVNEDLIFPNTEPEYNNGVLDIPRKIGSTVYYEDLNDNGTLDSDLTGLFSRDLKDVVDSEDLNNDGILDPGEDKNGDGRLNIKIRDWWEQFIRARDQENMALNIYLPGTSDSHPFRRLSFLSDVEQTILRKLPIDKGEDPRRLFELGRAGDHQKGGASGIAISFGPDGQPGVAGVDDDGDGNTDTLPSGQPDLKERGWPHSDDYRYYTSNVTDSYTRDRMLSKIINNTTTRSNVFVVFISVQSFVADTDPSTPGAVHIGNKLLDAGGQPVLSHRGVFVIDRTEVEEAFDENTGTFDWRKFVKHRLTIN